MTLRASDKIVRKLKAGELVLLDGGTGTELARLGADVTPPLWSARALIDSPELVVQVHADYIKAGAEVIVANTFRTSPSILEAAGYGHLADELPELAVSLALEAIEREGAAGAVCPAGCLSPLVDIAVGSSLSEEELAAEHEEHSVRQALAGVEIIICETMTSVKEAVIAAQAAKNTGLPFVVSFVASDPRHLPSGETLDTAVRAVEQLDPLAMAINCCPPEVIDGALATLLAITNLPVGAYAHLGSPNKDGSWNFDSDITPQKFASVTERWFKMGARLIGGCCGSTVEHIQAARERLVIGKNSKDN